MPLFRRGTLSPEAQDVADSLRMVNTFPEFEDGRAAQYMDDNRHHFAQEVASIVSRIDIKNQA